jgi:hypothetical protein
MEKEYEINPSLQTKRNQNQKNEKKYFKIACPKNINLAS